VGSMGGTMGGEVPEFRPRGAAPDSEPIPVAVKGFEWKDYSSLGAGWFTRGGHVYTLYFDTEDHRYVTYLGYVDPSNVEHVVCDFDAIEKERLRSDTTASDQLCSRVAEHQVSYMPVAPATSEEAGRDIDRSETAIKGWVSVDFRNTGRPERLALLRYTSGAARGCDFNYYEILENRAPVSHGDSHDLLMKLQGVDLERFHHPGPTCSDNQTRWFNYRGQIYLENRPGPFVPTTPFHEIKYMRDGRVRQACHGEFRVMWRVKAMWPHL